ncbi:MAG TPA: hydroxyacid dehydrogenase [Clostridia bacterium]|nr:hydroxyacid dehydrogenase [Clostridia bacterium]
MKFLVTAAQGSTRDRHFPETLVKRLEAMGETVWNPFPRALTRAELAGAIADVDVLVTHWGTPQVDAEMLEAAPKLRLIAHCAGTVAHIASEAAYDKGIPVLSANSVMAPFVAEGALAYILTGLRDIPRHSAQLKAGALWERDVEEQGTLIGGTLGMVGLGTVGRRLLDLLAPFGCSVLVFDPYLGPDALAAWPFARKVDTLAEVMRQPIVSVHAAQTPETYHIVGAAQLALMPDRGLLINTARGSLVDTNALIAELQSKRLRAVLDVYEGEPLSLESPLRRLGDNLILLPHLAGAPAAWQMTQAVLDDIDRWREGRPLQLAVSRAQFRLMTQE